jgi:hypothetical protein
MSMAGVILFLASYRWPAVARLVLALFRYYGRRGDSGTDACRAPGQRSLSGHRLTQPSGSSARANPGSARERPDVAGGTSTAQRLFGFRSTLANIHEFSTLCVDYGREGVLGQWMATHAIPLSLLRVRNQAIVAKQLQNTLQAVDFSRFAVVEAPIRLDTQATGELHWIENHPSRLKLPSQATGTLLAMIGMRFDRGWKMIPDGKPRSTLLVDGCLLGFAIPAGRHDIQLRFEPADFYLGARLAGLVLLALYLILGLSSRTRIGTRTNSTPREQAVSSD